MTSRKSRRSVRGITLVEIIAIILLLVLLALLSLPAMPGGLTRSDKTQVLSNMKQLHIATQQLALDGVSTGDPLPDWTCLKGKPITYDAWRNYLVPDYLSAGDFAKLTSVTEDGFWNFHRYTTNAIQVYAVDASDPDSTLLFATKNWHGPATSQLSGQPFDKKALIIFRKGGDGAILLPSQFQRIGLIGTGGKYNFLPLK
jgi:type II secretory pathway pseudopilin PulG